MNILRRWCFSAIVLAAVPLLGQAPTFAYLETNHFDVTPTDAIRGVGDVDGDGDQDALFGSVVYCNDGKAFFRRDTTLPDSLLGCLVDLDGDGRSEVVQIELAVTSARAVVYRRTAAGTYTAQTTSLSVPISSLLVNSSMVHGDLDGDGDADLVVSLNARFVYLRNDVGALADTPPLAPAGLPLGNVQEMALADLDLDGRLDLVRYAQVLLFPAITWCPGVEGGGFSPAVPIHQPLDEFASTADSMHVADFDGDGDPDVAYSRRTLAAPQSPKARVLRNDRSGWTLVPEVPGGLVEDRAVGISRRHQATPQLLVQGRTYNGTPYLTFQTLQPNGLQATHFEAYEQVGAPFAEVDLDGDLDVDWIGTGLLRLSRWTGADFPLDAQVANPQVGTSTLPMGRLQSAREALLPGVGRLQVGGILSRQPPFPNGLATTDLAFLMPVPGSSRGRHVAVAGSQLWTALDGDETWFGRQGLLHDMRAVAVDRHANVLATCSDFPGHLAVLDGFLQVDITASQAIPAPRLPSNHRILVADFEGDGHDDVIHELRWLRSTPTVTRQDAGDLVPFHPGIVRDLAAFDYDGDGDLDVYLTRPGLDLLLELRAGAFHDVTIGHIPTEQSDCGGVRPGDLDGDGDQDVLLLGTSVSGQTVAPVWLRNDGGVFTRLPFPITDAVLLADLEDDGDADVLTPTRWLRNTARQMHVPRLPLVGGPFVVDLHAQGGAGGAPWGLVAIGSPATPTSVPGVEGLLALDPNALVVIGLRQVQAGITTFATRLPGSALLFGTELTTQALWLEANGRAWLSPADGKQIW